MRFSPEVTLGNLLTILAFGLAAIGGFYGLKSRLDVVGEIIKSLTSTIAEGTRRVDRIELRHEQRMTKVEENQEALRQIVDRLVGEYEARRRWDGQERRDYPR